MTFRALSFTEEERAFLQQRVALFWKVIFLITLLPTTVRIVVDPGVMMMRTGVLMDMLSTALFGVLWMVCRTGRRSAGVILAIEWVGLATVSLAITLTGRYLTPEMLGVSGLHSGADGRRLYFAHVHPRGGPARGSPSGAHPLSAVAHARADPGPGRPLCRHPSLYRADPDRLAVVANRSLPGIGGRSIRPVVDRHLGRGHSRVLGGVRPPCRGAGGPSTGPVHAGDQAGRRWHGRRLPRSTRHDAAPDRGQAGRPTAVKLLKPDQAGETNLKRFEREVQLTARLTHPHTITIFDYGRTPDGIFYYAMELLDGAGLDRVVAVSGPLPAARVVHTLRHVAAALTEAHEVGLIHRDIKPANIFLCRQGGMDDFPMVLDFGLVKDVQQGGDVALTQADVLAGTPLFLSPEAITAPETVSDRSDVYSLGAVGYFALTGTNVFGGKTLVEVCSHHLHSKPEPPSARLGAPVPEELESLILDCLQKDPARRPAGAREVRQRLEACADVGSWTVDDAQRWWAENRAALSTEPEVVEDSELTLTRHRSG